jgi:hypothetical protein
MRHGTLPESLECGLVEPVEAGTLGFELLERRQRQIDDAGSRSGRGTDPSALGPLST